MTTHGTELEVVKLPPQYGLMNHVSTDKCMIDCEMVPNKLRWTRHLADTEGQNEKKKRVDTRNGNNNNDE